MPLILFIFLISMSGTEREDRAIDTAQDQGTLGVSKVLSTLEQRMQSNGWPKLSTIYTDTQTSPYLAAVTGIAMSVKSIRSRSLLLAGNSVGFFVSTYSIKADIEYGASTAVAWCLAYMVSSARRNTIGISSLVALNLYFYGREMLDV
jgi:hypothetical protein